MIDFESSKFSREQLLDAYKDGYRAYLDRDGEGNRDDLNPYNNNDEWDLSRQWDDGWSDAAWDD